MPPARKGWWQEREARAPSWPISFVVTGRATNEPSLTRRAPKGHAGRLGLPDHELGGHLKQCDTCGFEHPSYNSCRNRHCPKCQSLAKAQWLEKQTSELLPVGYFHLVFTLPLNLTG